MRIPVLTRLATAVLIVSWNCHFMLPASQYVDLTKSRRLVREALPAETLRLPGLTLWISAQEELNPSRCVTFDVLWSNPGDGSVHVGFWSIDRRTAEIWTPILCRRVIKESLGKHQLAVRKNLRVTEAEYQQSIEHGPCCVKEE